MKSPSHSSENHSIQNQEYSIAGEGKNGEIKLATQTYKEAAAKFWSVTLWSIITTTRLLQEVPSEYYAMDSTNLR